MRPSHLDVFEPVCPRCRAEHGAEHALTLATVAREEDGHVIEGALHCGNPACQQEYPILDGLPVLVANVRPWIADNVNRLLRRDDLTGFAESQIADCVGPGSELDVTRQHLSNYAWDHYGDLDPETPPSAQPPGSAVRCLERGLELLGDPPDGPVLDIGSATGRTTFHLAERIGAPVVGLDPHAAFARAAARVLREGVVSYPRKRVGVVYDRRTYSVDLPSRDVDFWVGDAMALPFAAGTFGLVVALNVLDCVPAPSVLLHEIERVLRPGGAALLASPYDWAPSATPYEHWIGGHSQRAPTEGLTEPLLASLLTPGAHPGSTTHLSVTAEDPAVPWAIRLHDRSTATYESHLLVLRRA